MPGRMDTFLFMGSTGGAGRTTSSVLFAAGLTALGFRPLHVQVMSAGLQPAVVGLEEVPFQTEWVGTSQDFLAGEYVDWHAGQHPNCFPIIVDMPAERIRYPFVTEPKSRILLPMRDGASEIEVTARDLRDAQEEHRRRGAPQDDNEALAPAWVLPIGWPRGLLPDDYATILGRRIALKNLSGTFPVIRPGLRGFSPSELAFSDKAGRFRLTGEQWDAATNLAWGILLSTESKASIGLAAQVRGRHEVVPTATSG